MPSFALGLPEDWGVGVVGGGHGHEDHVESGMLSILNALISLFEEEFSCHVFSPLCLNILLSRPCFSLAPFEQALHPVAVPLQPRHGQDIMDADT